MRLAFALLLIAFSARADLNTGLVAWWTFDAATGADQTDSSGNSRTLTHHGAPVQSLTRIEGAASSSIGSGNYFSSANAGFQGATTFSMACWARTTSTDITASSLWSRFGLANNIWATFGVGSAGAAQWEMLPRKSDNSGNGTPAVSTITWTANAWHLVCFGYDSVAGVVWISVDSETEVTQVNTGLGSGNEDLETGLGGSALSCLVDATGFWSRRLVQADITELYAAGAGKFYPFTTPPAPVTFVDGSFHYSSTIDAITNLYSEYSYPAPWTNGSIPVLVMAHPYTVDASGGATNMNVHIRQAIATNGVFVVAFGLRGRDGADGVQDDSGREVYDIKDGLAYVAANFTNLSGNYYLIGFSGGGGNTLNVANKMPDLFNFYVDYFGISDYGWNTSHGWWYTVPSEQSYLISHIGNLAGGFVEITNRYWSRAAFDGIATNLQGSGYVFLFHNDTDSTVPVDNSQQVTNAFSIAHQTNYNYAHSSSLYDHKLPDAGMNWVPDSLSTWLTPLTNTTYPAWTYPCSGTAHVQGYLVTKRFSVWLGGGTNAVADLTFNCSTKQYTVIPLSGAVNVTISQDNLSSSQSVTVPTTIDLSASGAASAIGGHAIISGHTEL